MPLEAASAREMRLDRFITLNIVQPLRRILRNSDEGSPWPVPVLMYHNITNEPEPGVVPYYKVNTSPAVFREHMAYLAEQGYKTITVSDLVKAISQGSQLSTPNSQLVAITFDDGFCSLYTEAFPVLEEFGCTATMFLATEFIGEEGDRKLFRPAGATASKRHTNKPLASMKCLTWNEVREMSAADIEFASHTVTHPKLVDLDWSEIRSELSNSKSEIEQQLGKTVTTFCYPYAFPQANRKFTLNFCENLQEAGYTCCTTTQVGRVHRGDDLFRLKRLPVNTMEDPELLRAKLSGAYDWVAGPQAFLKRVKHSVQTVVQ